MTSQSGQQKEQEDVDRGRWSWADRAAMTDLDWQQHVAAMLDGSRALRGEVTDLQSRKKVEEERQEEHQLLLQTEHKKTVGQHQVLLEKLESLRVKLQLNDSKASRKSFLLKKQEMTSQKNRAQEENNRLQQELGEVEERLISLQEEQEQEKRLLEEELSQLTEDMERVCETSQEVERQALEEEVVAVEKQREETMFSMEAWLREVGQYLQALRMDPSPPHLQERLHWEKQEVAVRRRRDQLQVHFQGLLLQLGEGRPLETLPGTETLPGLDLPPLPKVPTVELIISQILLSLEQATFLPPPPPPHLQPPPAHPVAPPRTPPPSRIPSTISHQVPPRTPPPPRITPPTGHQTPPPSRITPPTGHQTPPPSSGPVGKLDLLLDQLATKFPQYSRAHLMSALQHIKSDRGTMAGLSRDELTEQVGLKLAFAPLPIPQPPALRHTARSFCLMCQHQVEPATQQPLPCAHSIHRDCISVWLRSSGNNSCPFCPAQ